MLAAAQSSHSIISKTLFSRVLKRWACEAKNVRFQFFLNIKYFLATKNMFYNKSINLAKQQKVSAARQTQRAFLLLDKHN